MPRKSSFGAFLGVGRQAVLGTTVARSIFNVIESEGVKFAQPFVFPSTLRSPSKLRGVIVSGGGADGPISMGLSYTGQEALLKDLLGAVATSTLGSGAKQHDFTPATDLPSPGLSVELYRVVENFLYADCKVKRGTFRFTSDDEAKAEYELIGRAETNPAASTPSFSTIRPITGPHIATLTVDGVTQDLDDLEISIENNLERGKSLTNVAGREPQRNDSRIVTGSFNKDFEDTTIYAKFKSGASGALIVQATNGIVAGADPYTFRISCPAIIFSGAETPNVGGVGMVKQRVGFQAVSTVAAGNDEITLRLINDTASVI